MALDSLDSQRSSDSLGSLESTTLDLPPTPAFASEPSLEVTVLMPCLNEAKTVAACVRGARACLERLGINGEVLVADNGSTDGSRAIAVQAGARVVAIAERGYGAALYRGTLEARGRYIIMGDADDSYDFTKLDSFVEELRRGADLVMGNRFLGGIGQGAMSWKNRHIGNPALSGLGRLFFHSPVADFHCGLRGFSRGAFARMRLRMTGMEFASEMVVKATLLQMRIAEVPTTLRKDGRGRQSHLRPWRDGWRHLRFMLLYSPRWLFLYPGLALMIAGALVGVPLLGGPVKLGQRLGFDVHTLLFAFAAIVLGFQGVAFAICARVYALNEGLLPADPKLERLLNRFTLEAGLVVGGALMMLGLGGALYALFTWSRTGFGPLDARVTLRTAIPSASAICLGGQVVLTSFLLSFLGLSRR